MHIEKQLGADLGMVSLAKNYSESRKSDAVEAGKGCTEAKSVAAPEAEECGNDASLDLLERTGDKSRGQGRHGPYSCKERLNEHTKKQEEKKKPEKKRKSEELKISPCKEDNMLLQQLVSFM